MKRSQKFIKIIQLKNVFLLPHLGSASTETREAMGMRVFKNVKIFSKEKNLLIEWFKKE